MSLILSYSKVPSALVSPQYRSFICIPHVLLVPLFRLLPVVFQHIQIRRNHRPIQGHRCQVITEATTYCAPFPNALHLGPDLKGAGKKAKKKKKVEDNVNQEREGQLSLNPVSTASFQRWHWPQLQEEKKS